MKPIFKQEKEFLEQNLNIKLPNYCWRNGSKIYLNHNDKIYLLQFKINNLQMLIKTNNIKKINEDSIEIEYKKNKKIYNDILINKTWEQEYIEESQHILFLEQESIKKTKEYILLHKDYKLRPSISGGKDSDIMFIIFDNVIQELNNEGYNFKYTIDMFNTTNDTAQTYLHIKNTYLDKGLFIHNPQMGWYRWLKEVKNYYLPSVMVRNCCSTYKEGQLKKILDKNINYIIFVGMRKYESQKRSFYDWDLNKAYIKAGKKPNVPNNWRRFLPIVNWRDEDIWLYIIHNKVNINDMYKLGFNRCGCLICPYSSAYNDLLIKQYYSLYWNRWSKILEINYNLYDVENRLKWTLDEFINGKWKVGISKEQEIIQLRPTKENIKKLADIKRISINVAEKYFQKKCKCNKKLNPDEIAMFLKRNGRFERIEDDRQYLCKKCFCEVEGITSKEYREQIHNFRKQGCNLF